MRSMDSILADEPSVQTLPESAEGESPPAEAVETETEAGAKPEPVPAKDAQPPAEAEGESDEQDPDPKDFSVAGLRKALSAVRGDKRTLRKKWQEAERRIAMLEGQTSVLQKQQPHESKPAESKQEKPDFWADPEAFIKGSVPDVEAVAASTRANISEFYARQNHADYDERRAYFESRAAQDPSLWQQVFAAPVPAETLYKKAGELKAREEFDRNPDAWREAELAKLRSQLESGSSGNQVSRPAAPARAPIPKSNASARGSGAGVTKAWSGPRSLDDILA